MAEAEVLVIRIVNHAQGRRGTLRMKCFTDWWSIKTNPQGNNLHWCQNCVSHAKLFKMGN